MLTGPGQGRRRRLRLRAGVAGNMMNRGRQRVRRQGPMEVNGAADPAHDV